MNTCKYYKITKNAKITKTRLLYYAAWGCAHRFLQS